MQDTYRSVFLNILLSGTLKTAGLVLSAILSLKLFLDTFLNTLINAGPLPLSAGAGGCFCGN